MEISSCEDLRLGSPLSIISPDVQGKEACITRGPSWHVHVALPFRMRPAITLEAKIPGRGPLNRLRAVAVCL